MHTRIDAHISGHVHCVGPGLRRGGCTGPPPVLAAACWSLSPLRLVQAIACLTFSRGYPGGPFPHGSPTADRHSAVDDLSEDITGRFAQIPTALEGCYPWSRSAGGCAGPPGYGMPTAMLAC